MLKCAYIGGRKKGESMLENILNTKENAGKGVPGRVSCLEQGLSIYVLYTLSGIPSLSRERCAEQDGR